LFFLPVLSYWLFGQPCFLFNNLRGCSLRIEQPGLKASLWPPYTVKVRNKWSCKPPPAIRLNDVGFKIFNFLRGNEILIHIQKTGPKFASFKEPSLASLLRSVLIVIHQHCSIKKRMKNLALLDYREDGAKVIPMDILWV
jgi:hypothetical protein